MGRYAFLAVIFFLSMSAHAQYLPYVSGVKGTVVRNAGEGLRPLRRFQFIPEKSRIETRLESAAVVGVHRLGALVVAPQTIVDIDLRGACRIYVSTGSVRILTAPKQTLVCIVETPSLLPQQIRASSLDIAVSYSNLNQSTVMDVYEGQVAINVNVAGKAETLKVSAGSGLNSASLIVRPQVKSAWQHPPSFWAAFLRDMDMTMPASLAFDELETFRTLIKNPEALAYFRRESLEAVTVLKESVMRPLEPLQLYGPP